MKACPRPLRHHTRPLARLPLLGLTLALSVWTPAIALAATALAPDIAPWLLTPDDRAALTSKDAALQGLRPVTAEEAPKMRPAPESLTRMHRELAELQARLAVLPKDEFGLPPADASIYAEAVELQLKIDTWPTPNHEKSVFTCLRWGRAVAAGLAADPGFMQSLRRIAPIGYRSKVDRSAQPYVVILPDDYDPARGPYPLVVNLHGGYGLASPLATIVGSLSRGKDANPGAITVSPFGRANGGYLWTAETDVWDVIADAKRRFPIDENRIALTGFSMGGGGTAQLGLTQPGPFAAIAALAPSIFGLDPVPSARERSAEANRPAPLTEAEIGTRLASVYPGPALAENGHGVPWMLGVGADDRLRRVQEAISKAFDAIGVKHDSFVVPGVGHAGDTVVRQPGYREFLLAHVRDPAPREISFATTTLLHASRAWITVEGLTAHYTKALIHAAADPEKGTLTVTTDGIGRFSLHPPEKLAPRGRTVVLIDGEKMAAPGALTFEKADGKWRPAAGAAPALAKKPGLQGPVSDAFNRGFLCVRPTGSPWSESVNRQAVAVLEELRLYWRTHMFGELPVKADTDVTAEDRARFDLVLYGDPGSNRLIAETLAVKSPWSIPLHWDKDTVGLGAAGFATATHLPTLIYPSPLQPCRYVVFNGAPLTRTWGPRGRGGPWNDVLTTIPLEIGDFAILQVDPAKAGEAMAKSVHGGFFNEQWQ